MTTNQTIDGVPRKALEQALLAMKRIYQAGHDRILDAGGTCDTPEYMMANDPTARELRALLDAEACTSCDSSGEYIDAIGDWRGYCSCPAGVELKNRPTAQPQCEPVAYAAFADNGNIRCWSSTNEAVGLKILAEEGAEIVPLYRRPPEQPAPVTAVLPEREMYCQYLRGVIPDNRLEVEAHKDGWNACPDELKRLNPSL
ncbi:hypothetical protein PS870_06395 [Pseudomonas fluorescens]|uniref:Uncharacterized protein n=1 Tax=Pseudomonas fluorescens TaxID=294 RepID=A0A5E7QK24_PSEFL|nr:hypothetical protein [Pseudomonas fluorescens]VVP61650.1 hypothetical protein PS870_06395 [Pseudomonas fluorescens]